MKVLIKSATIVDSESEFHNKVLDILIEDGVIVDISKSIKNPNNYKELKFKNLHLSKGWFDSSVSFGEPGYEECETIANGLKTAALSGFTAVALNSNTYPIIDNHTSVSFLHDKAKGHTTSLYPIGAVTKNSKGEELSEMYDMNSAGAIAFYDYQRPIENPNIMKLALQYSDNFGGLVCAFPQDPKISGVGVMNENIMSTQLGLMGNPSLAEELQVVRDLFLLEYTGGKLHIPTISTTKSVALIREAKQKNLDVSCSVAIHNLMFTDEALKSFNSNFKVLPPLRTQDDINSLIEGLKNGTIDFITSDHNPINIERKKIEFENAAYGTIGLEAAFGALQSIFGLIKTIELLTKGKKRFNISDTTLSIGSNADVTLFNPEPEKVFCKEHILSMSTNCIYEGCKLKGHVYGSIANKIMTLKKGM